MTGKRNYLENGQPYFKIYVTFDDGAKMKIIGKCQLDYHGLPCLNDVLLVNDFNANLISINQLCNKDLYVKFNTKEYIVTNK